jgi:hypothetical protein
MSSIASVTSPCHPVRVVPFPDQAVADLRSFVSEGEPQRVTPERAAEIVEVFSEIERIGAAGKILFAARAAESTKWAAEGHRSAASWLASKQKSSLGEAIGAFETSERLSKLDSTKEALRSGEVTPSQAKEIALAAEKDPTSEATLLREAEGQSLRELRQNVRQVMARASSKEDEIERYRKIRGARNLRHWIDYDGAVRIDAKLAPEEGGRVLSEICAEADVIFERHRADGDRASLGAYRADALVSLVCGEPLNGSTSEGTTSQRATTAGNGKSKPRRRADTLVVRVDAGALRRGYVEGQEVCEIAGIGPVPVATATSLLPEAFLKVVIRDSVDVLSVCHVGRLVPAHVRTALEERDSRCVVPGCDVGLGLEIHHWRENYAESGTTGLDSICRICARHHDLITYRGFDLRGGPGKWEMVPPPRRKTTCNSS